MTKNKVLMIIILVLVVAAGGLLVMRAGNGRPATPARIVAEKSHSEVTPKAPRVPAFQSAEQARKLGPTLDPSQFFGKAREAYHVAQKIPQTLAQLPCYCHCDQSFGHKSLHTFFEDDHASHCAVCVDEALLAYQLQKQENLTPERVRERIVEKYSSDHDHGH